MTSSLQLVTVQFANGIPSATWMSAFLRKQQVRPGLPPVRGNKLLAYAVWFTRATATSRIGGFGIKLNAGKSPMICARVDLYLRYCVA
jgi:hypothetical protein